MMDIPGLQIEQRDGVLWITGLTDDSRADCHADQDHDNHDGQTKKARRSRLVLAIAGQW